MYCKDCEWHLTLYLSVALFFSFNLFVFYLSVYWFFKFFFYRFLNQFFVPLPHHTNTDTGTIIGFVLLLFFGWCSTDTRCHPPVPTSQSWHAGYITRVFTRRNEKLVHTPWCQCFLSPCFYSSHSSSFLSMAGTGGNRSLICKSFSKWSPRKRKKNHTLVGFIFLIFIRQLQSSGGF